jgi:hypothetical protein
MNVFSRMNGFENVRSPTLKFFEPWTFLLHGRTISSLNIPITWTNFTYEWFPFWKNFKFFGKMSGLPRGWNSFQLKPFCKKKSWTDFPKDVNRFLGWTGFFFKQFSKDELINTVWLPWMDFHAEQISIMKISITWMDFNYEMVSSFNNFHLWTNLKIYEVPRGTFLKNEKDYHL